MPPDPRQILAAAQARLVTALHGAAPPPDGFDHEQVRTAAEALLNKRMRGVEKAWPQLAQSLGHDFRHLFARYAAAFPSHPIGGPTADGIAFAQWLNRAKSLADDARLELAAVQVATGFPIRVLALRGRRRFAIVARLAHRRIRVYTLLP